MSGIVVQDMGLIVNRGVGGQGLWLSSLLESAPIARFLSNLAETSSRVTAATGTANRAYLVPIVPAANGPVNKAWWINGGTVSGNLDVGIYDKDGNRVASTGAVAQSGANAIQSAALTVVPTLLAGIPYYLAFSSSSATSELFAVDAAGAQIATACGFVQAATAHPLPATVTFAAMASQYLYTFGLTYRTTV